MDIEGIRVGGGDLDCINLSQERDQWNAVLNMVLNFKVAENVEDISCEEVCRCIEYVKY